jgi:hypothetical protein
MSGKVWKLWKNEEHKSWFNGWKKIYSTNNTMIIEHQRLFIHIEIIYFGLLHDANILW